MNFIQLITLLLFSINLQAETKQVLSIPESRQLELKHLVKHDCGSCHGMTMKGGMGPSLLKKDLATFSDEYLFQVIKFGRPQKAMPPWNKILTDTEIKYVIKILRTQK